MDSSLDAQLAALSDVLPSAGASAAPAAADSAARPATPPRTPVHAPKRGPGRPSKTPAPPKFRKDGIQAQPRFDDSRFEFSSDNPQMFKGIFTFFLKLKCDRVEMHFTPSALHMYSEDGTNKMSIQVSVDGAEMNWYCAPEPFWLVLNRRDVDKVFNAIDRSFSRIKISNSHARPLVLTFELVNDTLDRVNSFPIDVRAPIDSEEKWDALAALADDLEGFQVSWQLTSKELKKTHSIAREFSKAIKIEKVALGNLKLQYTGSGLPKFVEEYKSPQRIGLTSSLAPNEGLIVDYSADAGFAFASVVPTETVRIYCASDRPILFVAAESGVKIVTSLERVEGI